MRRKAALTTFFDSVFITYGFFQTGSLREFDSVSNPILSEYGIQVLINTRPKTLVFPYLLLLEERRKFLKVSP